MGIYTLYRGGVWHELLHNTYVVDKTLSQVEAKPTNSPFWKGIMGSKKFSLNILCLFLAMNRVLDFGNTFG